MKPMHKIGMTFQKMGFHNERAVWERIRSFVCRAASTVLFTTIVVLSMRYIRSGTGTVLKGGIFDR